MPELLEKFFPVPRALSFEPVGIVIDDSAITIAAFGRRAGARFAHRAMPKGAVSRGAIANRDSVRDVVREARERYDVEEAFVALPDEHAFFVKLEIPRADRATMRNSILFQLEEYVPLPTEQVIFDFEEVPRAEPGALVVVVVTAYPAKIVEEYLALFLDAGIRPYAFEALSQAVCRAVAPSTRSVSIVVSIRKSGTNFSFVNNGIVWFNAVVPLGGGLLEDVLRKTMQIEPDVAHAALMERGLSRTPENRKTFDILVQSISALRDEVAKLHRFWHTHKTAGSYEAADVAELLVTGEYAAVPGMAEYLSSGVGMVARVALPWSNLTFAEGELPPVSARDASRYSGAIGLALRARGTHI